MKRYAYLCLLPLLSACAQQPKQVSTLADLAARPEPVLPARSAVDRERAIAGYSEFLKNADDPMLKAEAMRRLADLTQEAQEERAAELIPAEADTPAPVPTAAKKPAVVQRLDPEPEPPAPGQRANSYAEAIAQAQPVQADAEQTPPEAENQRVIALYEARLEAYPYHPQNDQVLYQLSRAYEYAGRPQAALAALDRMVSQYPNSALIPEAQFRRGEMLFVGKQYEAADRAYRAVLGHGLNTGFYDQSLYKRGWSLFKQSMYLEGIELFLTLVDYRARDGRIQLDKLSRAEREQIEDTLRAISLSFAYLEGPDTVAEYFRSRGHRKDEDVLYRALGEEYLKKERYSDAASTFQAFVAAYPNSELAPGFQLRAIDSFRQGDFPSEVLKSREAYVRLFDLRSPYWTGRDPEQHPKVVAELKTSLRALARHYHAVAQKDKQDADYAAAADWYQRYLTNFSDQAGAQEMRFLFAELLFEHKDFPGAVEQYEYVAYRYNHNGRGADAGYAALQAYDTQAKRLQGEQLLSWQRQALASATRFAKEYPQHPKAAAALLHVGQALFALEDGEGATTAAKQLITLPQSDAPTRLAAWTMIGHTAFDAGDYLNAEQAYRAALDSPAVDSKTRRPLGDRLAATIYKQAEQRRAAGDLRAAAREFLRAAEAVADSSIRATAEYDAAAMLLELKDWSEAARVLAAFRRHHPEHPQLPEVTRRLAVAYLEAGEQPAAAAEFERVAAQAASPEQARVALWQAAELYRQTQNATAAQRVLLQYLERFPQPLETAMEARQQLLALALAANDHKAARRWREALVQADARAGAERSDRTRFLAAKASLALADGRGDYYRQLKLVEPLQLNLKKKKWRLEQALKAYADAADYGVAEVNTAASYAIAQLYADFARALLESERPASLSREALAEYEILLEEQAYPFEEKAIEVHEINVRRAAQGLYDPWVRRSYSELARLMPARYARAERSENYVESLK